MARNRMIKPSYWEDEKIGALSWGARLMFIGMWNVADDSGILRYNAVFLRSAIFPYDDIEKSEIESMMEELEKSSLISVYQPRNSEQKYCIIKNFLKHQYIDKPQLSTLPVPANYENILIVLSEHSATARILLSKRYGTKEKKEKEYKRKEVKKKERAANQGDSPLAPVSGILKDINGIKSDSDVHPLSGEDAVKQAVEIGFTEQKARKIAEIASKFDIKLFKSHYEIFLTKSEGEIAEMLHAMFTAVNRYGGHGSF